MPHFEAIIPDKSVWTVSELTQQIKQLLEGRFQNVLLQGEISNCKLGGSGHLYFSLKDAKSQISAVCFKSAASRIRPFPKDGDQVVVKGELSLYEPRGSYQIIVRELSHLGLGALLLQLEQLKQKLAGLGWFDTQRKKPLPHFPKTIGVVTSPTGAVIQDILNVLQRRHAGFHLILNPVKVQGQGAAEEIAQAIDDFNRFALADVLIVARGGGSIEDLFAFNDERVARAIYESRIPIISAVGHETDHTIADYVADIRAPTPSAAAELVLREKKSQRQYLRDARQQLLRSVYHLATSARARLNGLCRHPLFSSPSALLDKRFMALDELQNRIEDTADKYMRTLAWRLHLLQSRLQSIKPGQDLPVWRKRLQDIEHSLGRNLQQKMEKKRLSLNYLTQHLLAIDPKSLLKKGYTILFAENDASLIISSHQMQKGQTIKALLHDGQALLTVEKVTLS